MESYEMESPELTAQTIVNEEFPNAEIILGFLVSVRDPALVPDEADWQPVPRMADGSPDYGSLIQPAEMLEAGEPWSGIDAPTGGILNLTVLQELDTKLNLVLEHPLGPALKPLVNDVTGHQSNGAISLSDHFRGFMNNTCLLYTSPSPRDVEESRMPSSA